MQKHHHNTSVAGKQPDAIIPANTPIQKAAIGYVEAGFALTNVNGKAPTATGWNRRDKAITSDAQVHTLNGSIGLLHAYSGTCCIDIDDFLLVGLRFVFRRCCGHFLCVLPGRM